ncbi:ATP-dependent 6-phosphofructokinase [Telluria mixta]|uniref:ATP-dependent 6-phosphofructokinase n=1 Tax=Telluria mixta TaxID=34071 RepID=A0ABT2BT78_9BURK|nr:ATP-dependent 6-phosphofructokinase [Telluria mixta]MCS0628251.1 ATP-dependent 6-phosphofructokinase [Telluria mixta]WEM93636.1 ATP-dependent 6-phosphofructokinase [Telluria mixta]
MNPDIRRIALVTGGGDAPGLNAAIRAVVLAAARRGWACDGIRDGFNGLLAPAQCLDEPVVALSSQSVHGIGHLGGTILGSTNRGNPLRYPVRDDDGTMSERDRSGELIGLFRQRGFDALVMIGGDGSMAIADSLHQQGLRVVGVPKTIDNDLDRTEQTFGFDSAVAFATECIDRLHTTADSQHRILVVETMGRYAGWIALHAGMAGGAHAILLPEIPFDIDVVAEAVRRRDALGLRHSIVVVAEGALPLGGRCEVLEAAGAGRAERLGGIGAWVETRLAEATGKDCRSVVLGHLLRGGSPSAFDRILAARFGAAAVRTLAAGQSGVMVTLTGQDIVTVPLADVAGRTRRVPVDCDTVRTARELGICLGDRPHATERI